MCAVKIGWVKRDISTAPFEWFMDCMHRNRGGQEPV